MLYINPLSPSFSGRIGGFRGLGDTPKPPVLPRKDTSFSAIFIEHFSIRYNTPFRVLRIIPQKHSPAQNIREQSRQILYNAFKAAF